MTPLTITLEHCDVWTNGVRLHVVQAGPQNGPLVLLLHGFPEFWYGWRRQIGPLAAAGFRVWAPDLRGYNRSDKPAGVRAYRVDALAADVVGLINAAGREQAAALIGHDWGGMVAWHVASEYPQRMRRLAVLNCPHPAVFAQQLRRSPAQMVRSAYALFFQLPWLPEASARAFDWRLATRALAGTSRPGTFTNGDLARYRAAWSRPGAFGAMLHWYRAALRYPPRPPAGVQARVSVPTLLVWGARDRFLGRDMARPSIDDFCNDGRLVFLENATHWVQHEEPARVNALLAAFLRDNKRGDKTNTENEVL